MLARNKQALFWTFMFPLMFTFIFGLFFGKNSTVGTIGVINQADNDISASIKTAFKDSKLFTIQDFKSVDEIKSEMKKSKVAAGVVIPEKFGEFKPIIAPTPAPVSARIPATSQAQQTQLQMLAQKPKLEPLGDTKITIISDPGNQQVNSTLKGFLQQFTTELNMRSQQAEPIFSIQEELTNKNDLTYFDFILAGILGLALMNSSVIGISVAMSKYREDKILKRITTTPLPTWIFIVAEVTSRLVLNAFQIAVILLIGKYVFDAHIYGSLYIILLLALVGAILFQLMGFAVASLSKTTDAAQGMATAVTIPMMFLAGVFFPIDSLPQWLYKFVQFLPLAPLLRMIRSVMLEASSPFTDPKNALIVGGWIIIFLIFSIFRFRLSEE